jgi:acyl-coenzyme A thioesterase PaaI-like protein
MTQTHLDNLTPFAHSAQNRCFGCGQANSSGLKLEFLLAPDGSVVCPATLSDQFEGPHGFLHGGIIATLLDESMSKAVRARGLTAMTRHMEIDYWAEAHIVDKDGTALAQGKGLFVEVKPR